MRRRTDNKNGYNKNTSYKESSINSIRPIEPLIINYLGLCFKLGFIPSKHPSDKNKNFNKLLIVIFRVDDSFISDII